jgi:5,10-methylene-tetrahydrofolate dehydrogenase/methenyl tetrahydrofolate cyclohydrolase
MVPDRRFMTATLIDGKAIAEDIKGQVREGVEYLKTEYGITPGLATVLVGERPDSRVYVASKQKACADLGMNSFGKTFAEDISQDALLQAVQALARDSQVHGILVQLPLPAHINPEVILGAVPIEKDVDGFSPLNVGRLAMKNREPMFVPCTPLGCLYLIESVGTKIEGANAVVLGRSNIVGMPVAFLLLHRNATVTICHSRSVDLPAITRQADILVAAVGKPRIVKADWVKPGATVIDVGINEIPDASKKSGKRLVGDVDFDAVKEVAGAVTPVPGGVGPMTIAMLMQNTLTAAQRFAGIIDN